MRTVIVASRGSAGLVLALSAASAAAGSGQAPAASSQELPRFTLRQIVTGRNDSVARIPGQWYQAATTALPDSLMTEAYRAGAVRSGLQPLDQSTLATERPHHMLGLYRREELLAASQRTLAGIRSGISSSIVRARFDRIFRPQGEWIVDLHDAALAWARARAPGLRWETTRPALEATHWVKPGADGRDTEPLLRALYGLAVLAATDSARFTAARDALSRSDSVSGSSVLALLSGYTEGQRWYVDAVKFLLLEPWLSGGAGRSVRDYVGAEWQPFLRDPTEIPLPEIETRWFGHPQALPQYGVPSELFSDLVRLENPPATDWLRRNGESGLLRTLRWLPQGDTAATVLQVGAETFRLTTVSRRSRESINGFLEAREAIAIDPAFSPLLAVGALVHEWQHLLFRRSQLETFARDLDPKRIIQLPGVDPYLAEGFAEWSAERLLTPITKRWPLLGLGELEKRADMGWRWREDQHSSGYALVVALANALRDPAVTTRLLLSNAEHPARIAADRRLRKAWFRFRNTPDRVVQTPTYRLLIPEVTFTIEDGFPDPIISRIHIPGAR